MLPESEYFAGEWAFPILGEGRDQGCIVLSFIIGILNASTRGIITLAVGWDEEVFLN